MQVKLIFSEIGGWAHSLNIELSGPPDKVNEAVEAIRELAKKWEGWEEK